MLFQQVYSILERENISKYPEEGYRLGLDFGTSYTKASYVYAGNRGDITFNDGERTVPSVVYFDRDRQSLSLFKTNSCLIPVHYFKATMADKEEYDVLKEKNVLSMIQDQRLRDNFEFLCSVFFLANIIFYSSITVSKQYHIQAVANVSMGMPMSWNNLKAPIYNKALYGAIMLLDDFTGDKLTTISLEAIYTSYYNALPDYSDSYFDPKEPEAVHMTLPEVVTEVNFFLNKKNVSIGNYLIIDIGGGTTDFAFITKEKMILTDKPFYYCKYALVRELGDEIRKKKEKSTGLDKYISDFTSAFNECCVKAKKLIHSTVPRMKVKVFLMGGGAQKHGDFYKSILLSKKNQKLLEASQIETTITVQSDESMRYIIAKQLAKSDDGVRLLSGIPLHIIN